MITKKIGGRTEYTESVRHCCGHTIDKEKNDAWTKISPSCARNATTGTTRNTGRPD